MENVLSKITVEEVAEIIRPGYRSVDILHDGSIFITRGPYHANFQTYHFPHIDEDILVTWHCTMRGHLFIDIIIIDIITRKTYVFKTNGEYREPYSVMYNETDLGTHKHCDIPEMVANYIMDEGILDRQNRKKSAR